MSPLLRQQDMALQMCKMLILDVRREMHEAGTLYRTPRTDDAVAAAAGKGKAGTNAASDSANVVAGGAAKQ